MKVKKVLATAGLTGFYFDDKIAILKGAKMDGHFYVGKPLAKGYPAIRIPGESASVILVMEDGQIAYGDCVTGQYSGVGGRETPFFAKYIIPIIKEHVAPLLEGRDILGFSDIADILMMTDERRPTCPVACSASVAASATLVS